MPALYLIVPALLVLWIAYRYYSAFIAVKVWALDDSRITPAHRKYDGANYYPTSRWVLFGHHFAAIAGQLDDRRFLVGDQMTIADPYLVVMLMWAENYAIEVPERLNNYLARMKTVPAVARALEEEGLA